MMIRRDKAEFLDNTLKLFDGVRKITKKDLEIKYQHDSYLLYQTEKHLKILEVDGMIRSNVFDEYYLDPKGLKVLNEIEKNGYLANHRIKEAKGEAELKKLEKKEEKIFSIIDIMLIFFHFISSETNNQLQ